jgi:hypothetical protein
MQALAEAAPAEAEAVPAGHWMQPEAVCPEAPLKEPATQALQFRAELAPATLEKRPAPQGWQEVEAGSSA